MHALDAVAVPGSRPLKKPEHERYARHRSLLMPRLEAARASGYEKMTPGNAAKLDRKRHIADRVTYLSQQSVEVLAAKRRKLEEFLWLIHDTNPAALWEVAERPMVDSDGDPIVGSDGEPIIIRYSRARPMEELPEDLQRIVEAVTVTDSGKVITKPYSRMQANQELRKLLGIDTIGDDSGDGEFARMSDQELIAALAREANELGVPITLTIGVASAHDDRVLAAET